METLMPGNGTSQTYTPQLKTVLKTYQLTAVKSLQGPSSAFLGMECKNNLHDTTNYNTTRTQLIDKDNNIKKLIDDNNFDSKKIILKKTIDDSDDDTIICNNNKLINEKLINNKLLNYDKQRVLEFTIPILTTSDQNCSERCETILENERISCFVVGGERRLCLPQILNTVLQDFSLHQINQVCDELQIYCSRCTHDQLEELKLSGILPRNAPSCGLITQTDAERLVSSLLLRNDNVNELLLINNKKIHSNNKIICSKNNKLIDDNNQDADNDDNNIIEKFKVYHECFGKCKGLFDPDLFDSEDSSCIECLECGCQFSPQKFVRHVHRSLENRTCHWGFDSTNWRSYLLLSRDQPHYTKVVTLFTNLKERCPVARYKRKATTELKQEDKLVKRPKKDDCFGVYPGNGVATYLASPAGVNDPYFKHLAVLELASRTASAFRPWNAAGSFKHRDSTPMVPAYLSRGPPVLQHPERVVPLSECERFEPHYQPNVALAPIIVPGINSVAATTAAVPLQRRPHQERHRLNNETQSLTSRLPPPPPPPTLPLSQSLKLDEHQEVTVKIERPSSPCSDLINDYSVRSCSPVDQQEDVERQKIIKITQISSNDSNNNDSNNISNDNDEDEGNDNDDDDSGNDGGNNGGEDEEESSAAVTSSTVTVEPSIIKIGISSSPESSSSSTLVNDSDTETNSNAIIELEERLIALDVPQDVIGLVRKVADELNNLKIRRCKDANEILKLRDEISRKKINYDKMFNDNNEKIKVENSSAADSTEDNEAVDEKIIITTPLDNNHEPETPITISRD